MAEVLSSYTDLKDKNIVLCKTLPESNLPRSFQNLITAINVS